MRLEVRASARSPAPTASWSNHAPVVGASTIGHPSTSPGQRCAITSRGCAPQRPSAVSALLAHRAGRLIYKAWDQWTARGSSDHPATSRDAARQIEPFTLAEDSGVACFGTALGFASIWANVDRTEDGDFTIAPTSLG
jgi:hypothetical protein